MILKGKLLVSVQGECVVLDMGGHQIRLRAPEAATLTVTLERALQLLLNQRKPDAKDELA